MYSSIIIRFTTYIVISTIPSPSFLLYTLPYLFINPQPYGFDCTSLTVCLLSYVLHCTSFTISPSTYVLPPPYLLPHTSFTVPLLFHHISWTIPTSSYLFYHTYFTVPPFSYILHCTSYTVYFSNICPQ